MCSAEPSSLALAIGFGAASSPGSARRNPPSLFNAIRDGVTVPVKPDPLRTRVIVEKLLPSNIQCQVPANCSAVLEGLEPACRLIACASTARVPHAIVAARERAIIGLAYNDEPLFPDWFIIRSSKLLLHSFESARADVSLTLTKNGHEIGPSRTYRWDHACKEPNEGH